MEQELRLVIGCDLAGYDLKAEVVKRMTENGYKLVDIGCFSSKDGLYAKAAKDVCEKIVNKECDYGILICGTGQGMAMGANKIKGINAALCYDVLPAVLSKEHNNSNVLCTGAWMMDIERTLKVIEAWLFAKYAGNNDEGLNLLKKFEDERS